ncbi:hypothetical protein B0H10DRAFT_2430169 [Mycena sp. CBHHK59/15]|nr:hypothetical protein B0H10DRAFT_2430169 [Mycena sp. CBHHK59/15]
MPVEECPTDRHTCPLGAGSPNAPCSRAEKVKALFLAAYKEAKENVFTVGTTQFSTRPTGCPEVSTPAQTRTSVSLALVHASKNPRTQMWAAKAPELHKRAFEEIPDEVIALQPTPQVMEEEERLMEELANAMEDDVPDDGAIEIGSDKEYCS